MAPGNDDADDGSGGSRRRTDGWRLDTVLQEMAIQLGTTSDPLLTTMGELRLRYEQGKFYQRESSGSPEKEITRVKAFTVLQPKFLSAGAEEPITAAEDLIIEEDVDVAATSRPEQPRAAAIPPPPPKRREEPWPSTAAGEVEQPPAEEQTMLHGGVTVGPEVRLYRSRQTLEQAVAGPDIGKNVDSVAKAFEDYLYELEAVYAGLALLGNEEGRVDQEKRTKFARGYVTEMVKIWGTSAKDPILHYPATLEKLLSITTPVPFEKTAGTPLGVLLANNYVNTNLERLLPWHYSPQEINEYVDEGLQKVKDWALTGDDPGLESISNYFLGESHEALDKFHELTMKGQGRRQKELEQERNVRMAVGAFTGSQADSPPDDYRQRNQGLEKKLRRGKRAVWVAGAVLTPALITLAYFYVEYKAEYQQEYATAQQLQEENRQLGKDYDAVQEANKALQEGPQGQAWKAREQELNRIYARTQERVETAVQEADKSREEAEAWMKAHADKQALYQILQRIHANTWGERISANIRNEGALRSLVGDYISKSGGVLALYGPGCDRAVVNLHQLMNGSKETKPRFVESIRIFCAGINPNEEYVTFRAKK
ncbi:MAG: hypothetical protein AABX13_04585 [Nanoarchaeota archaeon]